MGKVLLAELLPLAVEFVRESLEEKQPEDELLKFGCIHLAAQDVGSLEEKAFELTRVIFWRSISNHPRTFGLSGLCHRSPEATSSSSPPRTSEDPFVQGPWA